MDLQKTHSELEEEEREIGKRIIPLISEIYENNYSRKKNFLTKIFCIFRDFLRNLYILFWGHGYDTRGLWSIEDGNKDFFDTYTFEEYKEKFGRKPPKTEFEYSKEKFGKKTLKKLVFTITRPSAPERWYPPGLSDNELIT